MSRIPELEIERLKQEVSIQRLVESIGVTLKRHGADLIGLCRRPCRCQPPRRRCDRDR